jgi:hypothetical protein
MPRIGLTSIASLAVLLSLSSLAGAGCLPENFPARWLDEQERLGGHTVTLHIGKSDQQLLDRLNQDRRLREESSFANFAVAEKSVESALQKNRANIEAWAARAKPRQRHAWHFRTDEIVGRGATRPAGPTAIAGRSGVTAVILKSADGSCTLYTAYPSR